MIIGKNVSEIINEYKRAGIKSENLEMYKDVKAAMKQELKYADKVERQYEKEERNKKEYEKKYQKTVDEIKKLKEKYPAKTAIARIPLIGRFGKVAKEYNSLRKKAKRLKTREKIARKNLKDLEPICKKAQKELKISNKDFKKCEKTLKRTYKLDKYNIEISKMYKIQSKLLERAYDEETVRYIKDYVEQIKSGKQEIKLPRGIETQKEFYKKLKNDLTDVRKGKKVETFKVEKEEANKAEEKDNGAKRDNKTIFAQKGLDIKREYVTFKKKTENGEIKLEPEEVLNYIGFISKKPENLENHSKEEIINAIKEDQDFRFARRGWDVLHEMIERIKDENDEIDTKSLSKSEKAVYKIAKKYVENEKAGKDEQEAQREKDEQEAQLA